MKKTLVFGSIQPWIPAIAFLGFTIASCSPSVKDLEAAAPASPASPQIASASSATQGYREKTLINGLDRPWGMAWLPDGAMLITEKGGQLRIVRDGKLDPTAIAGVPPVMSENQGGLLDVSVHPRFAENRFIYFTYSHGTRDANRTRLARAVFDGKTLKDVRVIFEVSQEKPDAQHFGSRILWLPDGTMLVAIGDGGNPPVQLAGDLIRKQAQNLRSHLGKIVRLNDDGSVPRDNPFANNPNANPKVWSYGHRNIQGLAFDPATKRVWSTEHGARGGDELNLVEAGKNYGWPVVTYSEEYFGGQISQERSRPGMVDPKLFWTPATAPCGLAFYTGDRFPAWKGNLFSAGLVSRDIRRIELDASGKVLRQESIKIGQRVRDVRQGPDGLLYFITDDDRLARLEPTGN